MRFLVVLAVITLCLWLTAHFSAQQPSWKPSIALGLPDDALEYYVPRNNSLTPAKIELGCKLFFDARLSAEGRVSCSSWHDMKFAFIDGRADLRSDRLGPRNMPTALNPKVIKSNYECACHYDRDCRVLNLAQSRASLIGLSAAFITGEGCGRHAADPRPGSGPRTTQVAIRTLV